MWAKQAGAGHGPAIGVKQGRLKVQGGVASTALHSRSRLEQQAVTLARCWRGRGHADAAATAGLDVVWMDKMVLRGGERECHDGFTLCTLPCSGT